MIASLLVLAIAGCSSQPENASSLVAQAAVKGKPMKSDQHRVLVVYNKGNAQSKELADYYMKARKIPAENLLVTHTEDKDDVTQWEFDHNLRDIVAQKIKGLPHRIDFIVLMKGVPIRVAHSGGYSVDAQLAGLHLEFNGISDIRNRQELMQSRSPYFEKNEPFNSDKFGFYLVTRLDGYTYGDAKRLVDDSLKAKPDKGLFYFDADPGRSSGGNEPWHKSLVLAEDLLTKAGMQTKLEDTRTFAAPSVPLMGYVSWGSNDGGFDLSAYKKLKFKPGSISETYVSTSARTFKPTTGGQSLIADLVKQGVTGVKGYVSEPYTLALAQPHILFDRYTKGYNLAESFYMASPLLKWKDLVVGDPLCAPYKK